MYVHFAELLIFFSCPPYLYSNLLRNGLGCFICFYISWEDLLCCFNQPSQHHWILLVLFLIAFNRSWQLSSLMHSIVFTITKVCCFIKKRISSSLILLLICDCAAPCIRVLVRMLSFGFMAATYKSISFLIAFPKIKMILFWWWHKSHFTSIRTTFARIFRCCRRFWCLLNLSNLNSLIDGNFALSLLSLLCLFPVSVLALSHWTPSIVMFDWQQ